MQPLRRLFSPVLLFCIVGCDQAAAQSAFSGVGRSKDGDFLMVGDREIRLFGIDAPEWDQTCKRGGKEWACGQEAAEQLSKLATGRELSCVAINTDEHGRTVAQCASGSVDLNQAMVASGYATAYGHYSKVYVPAEDSARAAGMARVSPGWDLRIAEHIPARRPA